MIMRHPSSACRKGSASPQRGPGRVPAEGRTQPYVPPRVGVNLATDAASSTRGKRRATCSEDEK